MMIGCHKEDDKVAKNIKVSSVQAAKGRSSHCMHDQKTIWMICSVISKQNAARLFVLLCKWETEGIMP
jgi:hypothetical protein